MYLISTEGAFRRPMTYVAMWLPDFFYPFSSIVFLLYFLKNTNILNFDCLGCPCLNIPLKFQSQNVVLINVFGV